MQPSKMHKGCCILSLWSHCQLLCILLLFCLEIIHHFHIFFFFLNLLTKTKPLSLVGWSQSIYNGSEFLEKLGEVSSSTSSPQQLNPVLLSILPNLTILSQFLISHALNFIDHKINV